MTEQYANAQYKYTFEYNLLYMIYTFNLCIVITLILGNISCFALF